MILKLLFKISFKVLLPVVASIGGIAYMSYMQGGDPMAFASRIVSASNGGSGGPGMLERASGSITGSIGALREKAGATGVAQASARSTAGVFKWTDATGATHFGSHPPADALNVKAMSIKPAPPSAMPNTAAARPEAVPGMPDLQLPGGMKLPEGIDYRRLTGHLQEPE